jgi:hypothetical protein
MEAMRSSETSMNFYATALCYVPQYSTLCKQYVCRSIYLHVYICILININIYIYILSRVSVTKTRVWIGESVYWIFTSNYN